MKVRVVDLDVGFELSGINASKLGLLQSVHVCHISPMSSTFNCFGPSLSVTQCVCDVPVKYLKSLTVIMRSTTLIELLN